MAAAAARTTFSSMQTCNASSHLILVQTGSGPGPGSGKRGKRCSSTFWSERNAAPGASASVQKTGIIPSPESSKYSVAAASDVLWFLKLRRKRCQNNIFVTTTAPAVSTSAGCRTAGECGLTWRGRSLDLGEGLQRDLRKEDGSKHHHHHRPLAAPPSALPSPSTEEFLPLGMASSNNELESRRTGSTELLVVGPGVLGSLVAQLWLKDNEGSLVVGQTNTTVHHANLKSLGIVPILKDSRSEVKFPNVIFCAPPSGSSDYPAEVRAAAQKWNGEGTFLFTSSSAVYDDPGNGECNEETARAVNIGQSPRTDNLLNAEAEVFKVGGNVVRLAGLYSFDRGAHMFYLGKGTVESRPDHFLNLIHYEDAASLCVAILRGGSRGKIYMGCDNAPISRQEMMDAVNASGKFEQKFKKFTGVDGPLGKKMNNNVTRGITHWTPKYESFPSFLGVTSNPFSKQ